METNIKIIHGKNEEECLDKLHEEFETYQIVSKRRYVDNWWTFWKRNCELVVRIKNQQVVLEKEEAAIVPLEKQNFTVADSDKKRAKEQLLKKLNQKQSEPQSLPTTQTTQEKEVKTMVMTEEEPSVVTVKAEEKIKVTSTKMELPEVFTNVKKTLLEKEVDGQLVEEYMEQAWDALKGEGELEEKNVLDKIKNLIGTKVNMYGAVDLEKVKTIAIIGPTGVGKTTTLAKLGWELHNKGKTVGFITTDTFRSGAKEQLKKMAEVMEAEVVDAGSSNELKSALQYFENVNQVDHILIDTVGRNPMLEESGLATEEYLEIANPDLSCLVLSATSKVKDMVSSIRTFEQAEIHGLIFTKLDETADASSILNIFNHTDLPVAFVANGQNITKNLYAPTKEVFINNILMKNEKLKGKIVV